MEEAIRRASLISNSQVNGNGHANGSHSASGSNRSSVSGVASGSGSPLSNGNVHANGHGHLNGSGYVSGNGYANGNGHMNGNGASSSKVPVFVDPYEYIPERPMPFGIFDGFKDGLLRGHSRNETEYIESAKEAELVEVIEERRAESKWSHHFMPIPFILVNDYSINSIVYKMTYDMP